MVPQGSHVSSYTSGIHSPNNLITLAQVKLFLPCLKGGKKFKTPDMEGTDNKLWIGPSFKSHKQTEIIQSFRIRPQCAMSVCVWVSSPVGWNGSQRSGKLHSPQMSSMLSTANQPAEGASWHGPTNRASPHASHTHLCLSLSPGFLLQALAFFLPEMADTSVADPLLPWTPQWKGFSTAALCRHLDVGCPRDGSWPVPRQNWLLYSGSELSARLWLLIILCDCIVPFSSGTVSPWQVWSYWSPQ